MKNWLTVGIATIFAIIAFSAIFIYFVSGVSGGSVPIRRYSYSGSQSALVGGLKNYATSTSDVFFSITDTTGNVNDGYAIHVKINVRNVEYMLKCQEQNLDQRVTTAILLVGIYDGLRNVGGYNPNVQGMDELVKKFERDVLTQLQKLNIELEPV